MTTNNNIKIQFFYFVTFSIWKTTKMFIKVKKVSDNSDTFYNV